MLLEIPPLTPPFCSFHVRPPGPATALLLDSRGILARHSLDEFEISHGGVFHAAAVIDDCDGNPAVILVVLGDFWQSLDRPDVGLKKISSGKVRSSNERVDGISVYRNDADHAAGIERLSDPFHGRPKTR